VTLQTVALTRSEARVSRTSDPEMGEERQSIVSNDICQPTALKLS